MPKISSAKPYTRITFDQEDWLAGLNPQYTTGLTDVPAPQVGTGLGEAIRFNPFRWLGYASPGFAQTDVTNVSVVGDVLRNVATGVESSTAYGYLISGGNKLQRLDVDAKSLTNAGVWPHTIVETGTITGQDVVGYNCNVNGLTPTNIPCIFYSYNDSDNTTTWNVGRYKPSVGTFAAGEDTYLSGTAAGGFVPTTNANGGSNLPHPLVVGADDLLYIGDGNRLHSLDGGTGVSGTFAANRLVLPQGYVITSFARISQPVPFLVIFAYYSPVANSITPNAVSTGPAKAFFYDYLSFDPTYVIDLDDRIVTAAFEYKGTVGCFTQGNNLVNDGANRLCRLKVWNGSIFATQCTFIGNAPIKGGVDVVGDSIQWNFNNGSVCNIGAFGSPFEAVKAGFNLIGTGTGSTAGVLRTLNSTAAINGYQIISSGTTTSGGLQYMKVATYAASSSARTIALSPQFSTGMKGKVRAVGIDFAKTSISTGAAIDVYLVYQNSDSSQIIATTALVDSSNITKWYYVDQAGAVLPQFSEISVLVRWTAGAVDTDAPIVRRVTVDYEEVPIEQ